MDMETRRGIIKSGMGLAAIIAAGKAPAALVESMIASRGTNVMISGGGWQNPYVTDGLVGMWDGEWNAGPGVHNPNATTWADLTGNGQDCYQNGDIATPLVGDNCIYFDTTRRSFVFDFAPSVAETKFIGCTVEICGSFTSELNQVTNPGFFAASPFVTYKGNFVCRYAASQLTISSYSTQVLAGMSLSQFQQGFSVITTGSDYTVYTGGNMVVNKSCSFTNNQISQNGYFGFMTANQQDNPRGLKIYSCRIYSRALIADEMAANCAIDKARFGLPD